MYIHEIGVPDDIGNPDIGINIGIYRYRDQMSRYRVIEFLDIAHDVSHTRLVTLLPAWEVGIQTCTMGIRGSHDPDRWHANLTQFGLPATRMEALPVVRNLTLQALTELTNLYSTRYAALHCLQHAQ